MYLFMSGRQHTYWLLVLQRLQNYSVECILIFAAADIFSTNKTWGNQNTLHSHFTQLDAFGRLQ